MQASKGEWLGSIAAAITFLLDRPISASLRNNRCSVWKGIQTDEEVPVSDRPLRLPTPVREEVPRALEDYDARLRTQSILLAHDLCTVDLGRPARSERATTCGMDEVRVHSFLFAICLDTIVPSSSFCPQTRLHGLLCCRYRSYTRWSCVRRGEMIEAMALTMPSFSAKVLLSAHADSGHDTKIESLEGGEHFGLQRSASIDPVQVASFRRLDVMDGVDPKWQSRNRVLPFATCKPSCPILLLEWSQTSVTALGAAVVRCNTKLEEAAFGWRMEYLATILDGKKHTMPQTDVFQDALGNVLFAGKGVWELSHCFQDVNQKLFNGSCVPSASGDSTDRVSYA